MVKCVVKGCKNYSNKKNKQLVRYFSFPNDENLKKQWISACQIDCEKHNIKYSRVCSNHFTDEDYSLRDKLLNIALEKRKLKKYAVPSMNLPVSLVVSQRSKRLEKRSTKKLVEELLSTSKR